MPELKAANLPLIGRRMQGICTMAGLKDQMLLLPQKLQKGDILSTPDIRSQIALEDTTGGFGFKEETVLWQKLGIWMRL